MSARGNRLVQVLARDSLRVRSDRNASPLADWVARQVRRALVAAGDPLVSFEVEGIPLDMPVSHDLPYHLAAFPQYGSNLGRLAAAVWQAYPGRSVVCERPLRSDFV
jgi:hypothetical protein